MGDIFRLAHLSDPHLAPPDGCGGAALKQRMARRSWNRAKSASHRTGVLDRIVSDILEADVDHIVVTGDITNFSTDAEKAQARGWLESFADPHRLTVTPGNHDALVPAGADPWALWRPWMEDEGGDFPRVRVRGRVMILNLCSAVPTPVLSARGRIGSRQRRAAERLLKDYGDAGFYRVVLLHHAPVPKAARFRKALSDAAALAGALEGAGAELVLHGHLHAPVFGEIVGARGRIPVVGAPSASHPAGEGKGARWNLIEVAETARGYESRLTSRGLLADGSIGDIDRREFGVR